MKSIPAIYKDRMFKPLEEVDLEEDTKVMLRIERDPVEDMDGLIIVEQTDAEELIETGYEDLE
jgi:predicted DNA-binding antitoxin AbrB/MazE fold protein